MDDRLTTFVATDGTVLKLRPVREVAIAKRMQIIEEQMRKAGAPVDVPTRTIVALGGHGDAEQIPLTAETLEVRDNPEQTARNRALWAAHQDAIIKLAELQREERIKTMLALGVEIEGGVPPIDEWKTHLEYLEIPVPENPLDQKAYYLMFVVLNDYDLNVITTQLLMLRAGKAVTADQVASFQATIQSEMGEAVNTLVQSTLERIERIRVARTSPTSGDANSGGMGVAA